MSTTSPLPAQPQALPATQRLALRREWLDKRTRLIRVRAVALANRDFRAVREVDLALERIAERLRGVPER